MLCNSHHITTHNDSKLIMWALIVNVQLNVCEIYYMKPDRSTVFCHQLRQVHNLLFRTLAGIRRSMEINSFNLNASLCDHISCHRAVNSTGKKQHCLSIGSNRHSARSLNALGIYINFLTDFNRNSKFRLMYIHLCLRKSIQNAFTDSCTYFHGIYRIGLLCTSCIYLEGAVIIRMYILHVFYNVRAHLLKSFVFVNHNRTDVNNTEYCF